MRRGPRDRPTNRLRQHEARRIPRRSMRVSVCRKPWARSRRRKLSKPVGPGTGLLLEATRLQGREAAVAWRAGAVEQRAVHPARLASDKDSGWQRPAWRQPRSCSPPSSFTRTESWPSQGRQRRELPPGQRWIALVVKAAIRLGEAPSAFATHGVVAGSVAASRLGVHTVEGKRVTSAPELFDGSRHRSAQYASRMLTNVLSDVAKDPGQTNQQPGAAVGQVTGTPAALPRGAVSEAVCRLFGELPGGHYRVECGP